MTRNAQPIDAQRVTFLLNDLRLPAIKQTWPNIAARADKEGWPAARFLAALAEHEVAERDRRRIERHLGEARLPPGKTLDSFAFAAVPMISRAQVMAIFAGDGWIEKGGHLIRSGTVILARRFPWTIHRAGPSQAADGDAKSHEQTFTPVSKRSRSERSDRTSPFPASG